MSLELIVGPPNSGRAGAVLERLLAAIDRDPLLVVPTGDDVDRFERELCGRAGGVLGGEVTTFPRLFDEVARACGVAGGEPLSRIQRVWLARAAAREAGLRILRGSAAREGFAPALEALLADLQSDGLDAVGFAAAVEELEGEGAYEAEIARLFAAYERLRDGLGRSDEHGLAAAATAALRADPAGWRRRPVLLYGFDDLSREQIELLAALDGACELTVALAFEDRPALAARAELLGVLRDELGGEVVAELDPDPSHTGSETLFHLERNLFEPEPGAAPCDEALTLLEAAGARGEAELIARHIARLIAAGRDPDSIAIAVRNPDRQAPPLARALADLGIPVAAEASVPLGATATGATLLRLLAIAGPEGSADDVVAFLRGPARARPENVDWLERRVRRERLSSAEQALACWERPIWALDAIAEAGEDRAALAAALGRAAAEIAERPHLRAGPRPSSGPAIELRAAAEARAALEQVTELGALAPGPEQVAELLGHVRVPLWRGPTEGRVRILSPYRLRASRVAELFVAELTDGSFPSPGASDPLLSDQRRRELGLPSRRDPAAEERFLFYSCVSRPERHLYLSYPGTDESGATLARSPFVDEVRELLEPPPTAERADDALEQSITDRIGIEEVTTEPELATSPRALARAIAALGEREGGRRLDALELPATLRERTRAALRSAREAVARSASPGPLRHPAVLAELGERRLLGASTLEEYDLCSYRWFVSRELAPEAIEPDPEALETGGIVHAALERLYREQPAGARPSAETVGRWIGPARELLRSCATERGWDLDSAGARVSLARLDAVVERFLRRDAETGGPLRPEPELLELAFGVGEDPPQPPVRIGDFELHGRIDRIDVSDDRKALIRDYKLSTKAIAGAKLIEEGKLQLPLYLAAIRSFGLEPIGGLYHPLAASSDDRPRGVIVDDHRDALVPGDTAAHVGTDFKSQEDFDELLAAAVERADGIVTGIRAGRIGRNPRQGRCPDWCGFAPICRMERAVIDPEDEEGEAPG